MIAALITGMVAAIVVAIPPWVQARFPEVFSPMLLPGVAALAMVLQRFVLDRRSGNRGYDGMADLLIHIHSPSRPDTALRWGVRSINSFLLSVCGGVAGPEGAAVECGHALSIALRPRSARWFEQRRRTDAALALAAGVSAAFGAPFAGFLLSIELGMGGRAIAIAVASLTAFVFSRAIHLALGLGAPDLAGAAVSVGASFLDPRAWGGALIVGIAAGVAGAGIVRFFRYAQESLLDLFQTQTWMRTLCAGVLLFLVVLTYRGAHLPATALFEQALWGRYLPLQAWLLFLAGTLSLSVLLAGFGTLGIFWPVLGLGGLFGAGLGASLSPALGAPSAVVALAGGAAFWGALLGAPVAGGVLAFELSQNLEVLLPCLAAGMIAQWVRQKLGCQSIFQSDLEARGLGLIEGRSAGVLSTISVRDAMVTDHEIVHEQEPVSEIHPRLLKSRYPFLPVVNSQNQYTGLLTVDLIQDAWRNQSAHSNVPLSQLLEAKDLLYRGGLTTPTIKVNDRLSATAGVFEQVPCVPVLNDEGRVVGLLFIHNVRLAYDREMARRSLMIDGAE